MSYRNHKPSYSNFILIFVLIKILLNGLAMSHFGFHRDELLHLALGDHLNWGYKEVPPFIAVLAWIITHAFGASVFAARIFPTIFGGLIIWLTGLIVVELGGRRFAIALACLALIFDPAFAASDYLFQPVVFDQFWWVLSTWLVIRYLNTHEVKFMNWLGVTVGLGMLTKYSMVFFAGALVLGLLMSKQRKMLFNRHVFYAALIAFAIFLPNIIWQFTHHLPVFTHMKTLQSTQLDSINPNDFAKEQLLVNGIAMFLWVTGLINLLFSFKLRNMQFLAFAYFLVFGFLYLMHGKVYYIFGAYPMLFAAGAFSFERWLKKPRYAWRAAALLFFTVPNLIFFPMVLPFLPLNQTLAVIKYLNTRIPATRFVTTWEDHKRHPLTQDYADMLGWDEMAAKVAKIWYNIPAADRQHSCILTDNYGEAGAIHHFRKKYNLPDVVCLNSSFSLWAPSSLNAKYIIYVSDDNDVSDLKPYTESYQSMGTLDTPYAREKGIGIFVINHPKPSLDKLYRDHLNAALNK